MSANRYNVLLVGAHLSNNFGGPSLILGIMRAFRTYVENCEFVISGVPWDEQAERAAAQRHGVRFVPLPRGRMNVLSTLPCAILSRAVGRALGPSRRLSDFIRAVQSADVVVGSLGIMFSDSLTKRPFLSGIAAGTSFGAAKILGKPVVQYTADFGPLRSRWSRFPAHFWLGSTVDRVLCRNLRSYEWLTEAGVSASKLHVAPDTGFLMQPAHSDATMQTLGSVSSRPLVAVGVSHQVRRRFSSPDEYDACMVALARHIVTEKRCGVLVVPNELHAVSSRDDRWIAQHIFRQLPGLDVAVVDAGDLSGPELKAVLGECHAIVSSRYHTLVAGLSMAVPCLAVGWHHKYRELFGLFGLEQYTVDYSQAEQGGVIAQFDRFWEDRRLSKKKIEDRLPGVEAAIMGVAHDTAHYLASRSSGQVELAESQDGRVRSV